LSIENNSQVVFRTIAGRNLFTGVINKKSAKIKACEPKEGPVKYKLKFTAVVTTGNADGDKFAVEHL